MKFSRDELIELWEMGKPAAAVTLPSDKHCALVDQCIEMMDALQFYADPENWNGWDMELGTIARKALGIEE